MTGQDACFTGLPIELIEHIFAHLWDPLDLVNASSTCKQLRAASERPVKEHLMLASRYSNLNFDDEDPSINVWTTLDEMLKDPRIPYHVCKIDFGLDRPRFYDASVRGSWEISPTTIRPPRDLLDRLLNADGMEAILRDGTEVPPLWNTSRNPFLDLEDGIDDPINSAILRQLPNLHEISLVDSGEDVNLGRFLVDTIIGPQQCTNPPFLSKLKDVKLEHWDTEGGMRLNFVLYFMHFPSVRTIRGHMIHANGESALATSDSILLKSNITTLILTYSNVDLSALEDLLNRTKGLKSFSYAHAGANVGDADYDPRGIIACLLKHAGRSLEVLKFEDEDDESVEEGFPYCSLSGFDTLKIVDIRWSTLSPDAGDIVNESEEDEPLSQGFFSQNNAYHFELDVASALPATIQRLKLTKFPDEGVSSIVKLLEDDKLHGALPNLSHISLCRFEGEPASDWNKLYKAAKTADIVVDQKADSTEAGIRLLQSEWNT
ncbi:hypothetical protein EJ08DRAFT_653735 [Tothia fuscella]|uniref:F-box domain-containing protein n=1 Tax=Tothia fuscella TaxID=1048955 RepID=A0A9P4NGI0_9PEZI|nr:hypothetical protein EJ08DRAFT_653735 [Tothia fuscella]